MTNPLPHLPQPAPRWVAKTMSGLVGLCSAILMTLVVTVGSIGTGLRPRGTLSLVQFMAVLVATGYFVIRGRPSTAQLVARSALVSATEWLVMGLTGLYASGRLVTGITAQSASDIIGGGYIGVITGGVSLVMASVSLLLFAAAYYAIPHPRTL